MTKTRERLMLSISTVMLGLIAGLGSLILANFLDIIEKLFLNFNETPLSPFAANASGTRRLVSMVIGGVIAAIVWYYMRTKMKPTVSIAKALDGETMPVWTTAVHVFTQIFFVATGGSVGRELAPREFGAMLSQTWQRFLHRFGVTFNEEDRKLLIAAAAGAGFAAIYIAPLTGTMFSVELLYKKVTGRAVAVSLTMSSVAMLVGSTLRGFHPYYAVGNGDFSPISVVLVIVVGPLCGVVGAYFRRFFQWANKHQARDRSILWLLPAAAVLTGAIAYFYPEISGNGRALAQPAMTNQSAGLIGIFLIGGLAKALITVFSLRAGASGGTLTPSIGIGATIGMSLGVVAHMLIPGITIWQGGLIGAATLLASSQQAPFMALFMIFEVCHLDYSALLPLGLGVALASASSQLVLHQSKKPQQQR